MQNKENHCHPKTNCLYYAWIVVSMIKIIKFAGVKIFSLKN